MNLVSDWLKKTFADTQMVILLLVFLFVLILMLLFASMLAPAIAALVVAFLLDGPVEWFKRRGTRPMIAMVSVYLGFILIFLTALIAVLPPLIEQISQFVKDSPAMAASLQDALLALQTKFPDLISEDQVAGWFTKIGNEIANLGPRILQYSVSGLTGVVSFAVYAVLIPVMVFFFLKDKDQLLAWVAAFLPNDKPLLEQVWREITDRAGDYARGKVYEILIVGSVAFITYQTLGLRYATLLAVATGFSVVVPYFGAAVVTFPVALVAYFQWGMGGEMFGAVLAYLIIQALDGNLLAPLLFSEVVKLHPNAIIIAILVFGGLWGLWGVFFAIPLATVANAIIRAWRQRTARDSVTTKG